MTHPRRALGPLAVAFAAALIGSGCAIQPPPSAEQTRSDALGGLDVNSPWRAGERSDAPLQDRWIEQYGDRQLNALVAEALSYNADLRVAAARVEQASESLRLATSMQRPTISLVGTTGIKFSDLSSALTGIVALISWELDLWGGLRYGRESAAAGLDSARYDEEFARQSLAATTAKAWFTATQTLLEQRVLAQGVSSAEHLAELTRQRERVGAAREAELDAALAFLGSQRDAVVQAQFAHTNALRALELLVGRYPAAELRAAEELPRITGPVPAGLPLAMLERRPDLRAAERRVAAAFNRVGQAKAAALPSVRLTGNLGYIDSDIVQLKQDFDNPAAGGGVKFLWPLYTGGGTDAQVGIETARQREAVAQYARLALRAIGDVETALAATQMLVQREQLLAAAVASQGRVLQAAQSAYRVGARDLRSVEQQQLDLYTANVLLLRVRTEQLIQRVTLHLALGGSFVEPLVKAGS
jgi:NodT family efflux transporter outer membrane factor (OMF) lipoprotein